MAKYGKFESYEPVPELGQDVYRFGVEGGQPILAHGQAALDLKGRLDAYDSVNRPQVAGPGGGPVSKNPFSKSMADLQNTGNVIAQQNREGLGLEEPTAAPQPAPQGGGMRPLMVNGVNTGYVQDETGRLYEHRPGTAAVKGGVVPTAQTESVTGGFEPDKEYLADRAIAGDVERSAMDQQRAAELQAETEGRAVAQEQFAAASGMRDEQQRLVSQLEQQVAQAQATRQQALADYTGSHVEPNRIFQGGVRPLLGLMAAFAAGGGAYAAAMNKTENFAGKAIDAIINRDIAAQEADIRIKKDKSDSALGDLMRRGMSLEQAKGTLGTIQRDWAKQQMMLARGSSSNEAINAKWDAQIAGFDKKSMDEEQAYLRDAHGKASKTVQAQIVQERAATAGGLAPVAAGKSLGIAGQTASTEGTVVGTAKGVKDLSRGGGSQYAGLSEGQSKNVADIDASLNGLAEMEKLDGEDHTIVTTGTLGGEQSQKLGAAAAALGPGVARAIEGDAATKDSMDAAREGLLASSRDRRHAAREAYRQQLERKKRAILEGAQK